MKPFKVRLLSIVLLVALLSAFPASPAQARTLAVIYVRQGGSGLKDGTSWLNAYADLQLALAAAPRGGEIWVARGTYRPITGYDRNATFLLKNRVHLYGGFLGTETFIGQRNPSVNITTLSGNIGLKGSIDNSYHVVTSIGTDSSAVIDGFTISYGNAHGSDSKSWGGGMYIESGSPKLRNIIFSNNDAVYGGGLGNNGSSPTFNNVTFNNNSAYLGGGMYNSSSNPTLTDVTFSGNSAPNGGGGGMYNLDSSPTLMNVVFNNNISRDTGGGMVNTSSHPVLTNVTFSSNSATNGSGGGMYNTSSHPALTDVTFTSNSADYGGGIDNYDGTMTLTNVIFSGNSVTYDGGGMNSGGDSNPTLTNVTFTFNSAGGDGGGMQIGSSATLTDVTFRGNTAVGNGGGLYNNGDAVFTNITFDNNAADNGGGMLTHGSPTLTNVTLGANSAHNYGGGMVVSPGASPTLTNVTFKNNSAGGYGGALFNNSEPVLSNAILWGNSAPEGAQLYSNGKAATINNSVVQDGCPDNSICTDIIKDDPLLGVLANYGGSTKTIPLEPGSSAIDTGDDAVCPATDQRGVPRPQGSHCDIGAYEAAAPAVGAGMYDDTDPAWSYSGTWSTWSGTGPYNNTMHYTNETGATAIFTFQAPAQFTLYFQATANRSDILVSVDGGAPVLVNAYNAGSLWQQTYTSPMYSNSGTHIVTVTTPGNGDYIDVDAIEIK